MLVLPRCHSVLVFFSPRIQFFAVLSALLCLSALCPASLHAQAISGDVVGTVLDKSGAAVPNAAISALNVATGVKSSTTSNGQGEFRFGNLSVGTYTIQVSALGLLASKWGFERKFRRDL